MGETFELEVAAEPLAVHVTNARSLLSGTVHLTDDRSKTLCGKPGPLTLASRGLPATCKLCLDAKDSVARVKRMFK